MRFYVLHIGVLPWIAALLLWLHLLLVWRFGLTEPVLQSRRYGRLPSSFFPDFILNMLIAVLLLFGILVSIATFFPAALTAPADPVKALGVVRPRWYFMASRELVRLLPGKLATLALLAAFTLLILVPVIDGLSGHDAVENGRTMDSRGTHARGRRVLGLQRISDVVMGAWSGIVGAVCCLLLVARAHAAPESCVTCHPDVRTQYEQGVHREQFGCTGCHGGDPAVLDASAHAPDKGYMGAAGRLQIPALCGGCHSDAARMRPFGIPTDQYARYQTSEHGIRLAKGDDRVAVCTDCHGVHRILAPTEPTSPVAPANIPATCGRCHSNKALMDEYKLPSNQEQQYRSSVHGIALFVEERRDAPTCATCHGVHGAALSEGQEIGTGLRKLPCAQP